MLHPPPVERIQRTWLAQAEGAREQVSIALFFALATGGAHLARLGTPWARVSVGVGLVAIVVLYVVLVVVRRREKQSTRLTVARVLLATDPAVAARALRALTLVERTARDDSAGSPELAELHFTRIVESVTSDAVKTAAKRYAQRFRALTLALLSLVVLAALVEPGRIAEGLDVLAARRGRAPVPMSWTTFPHISAVPPSYTREPETSLAFGTSAALPKGTVVTVRAIPRDAERKLVLTDGRHEESFASDGSGGVVARWTLRDTAVLRVAAAFGEVLVDDVENVELSVVQDLLPVVGLEDAPKTVRLSDVARIDVRWTAKDDHGLREVDLVLRSGTREERRVLQRFDGESRAEHGGTVVLAKDAFLRRMFQPILLTVEAKDNDPLDGPKWASSEPITIVPPAVGQPEAERYAAVKSVRDRLVDLLETFESGAPPSPTEAGERATALARVSARMGEIFSATYSGAKVPRGMKTFLEGQLDKLMALGKSPTERTVESSVLAVDAALAALGRRDATEVSKHLGDVAEDAALTARVGRDTEKRQEALSKLAPAIAVLEGGASHLVTLGELGRDVGSVARADTARVHRAADAGDLLHAELAALHLAERLRRPTPSFGSTTGHGRGAGSESGRGAERGDDEGESPPPTSAESDFDESASSVAELAAQHKNTLDGVENALREAAAPEPSDAERSLAKEKAAAIRRAASELPLPGQEFGTPRAGAALARELAMAAAHDLDDAAFERAVDDAQKSLAALDGVSRSLPPGDALQPELEGAKKALREARDFAEERLARQRAEAAARSRDALLQASDTERDLSERAGELAKRGTENEGPLPRELAERLDKAGSVMREAARELAEGHGDRAVDLQREAQRMLEQSETARTAERDADEGQERGRHGGDPAGPRGDTAVGGAVPDRDDAARAEAFRKRVLDGLGRPRRERLGPAIRRYAEGLVQ